MPVQAAMNHQHPDSENSLRNHLSALCNVCHLRPKSRRIRLIETNTADSMANKLLLKLNKLKVMFGK